MFTSCSGRVARSAPPIRAAAPRAPRSRSGGRRALVGAVGQRPARAVAEAAVAARVVEEAQPRLPVSAATSLARKARQRDPAQQHGDARKCAGDASLGQARPSRPASAARTRRRRRRTRCAARRLRCATRAAPAASPRQPPARSRRPERRHAGQVDVAQLQQRLRVRIHAACPFGAPDADARREVPAQRAGDVPRSVDAAAMESRARIMDATAWW